MCVPCWNTAHSLLQETLIKLRLCNAGSRSQTVACPLLSLSYISRLNELSLETLELRSLKQDFVVCFKIVNGDVDIEPNSFITFSTNCITRGRK